MSIVLDGTAGITTSNSLTTGTGAIYNGIASGTAVASTSGTAIDFTGIPSWVKRITIMFNGVSTSGASPVQVQVGAGSVTTSGYLGTIQGSGASIANFSAGFKAEDLGTAAYTRHGILTLVLLSSNVWAASISNGLSSSATAFFGGGSITLSGALDRIRITTVNGTDTFDAGSINIMYE